MKLIDMKKKIYYQVTVFKKLNKNKTKILKLGRATSHFNIEVWIIYVKFDGFIKRNNNKMTIIIQ